MEGLATLVASVYPKHIIVRLPDFKSNEYSSIVGGEQCEQYEEDPMMGGRGCGSYTEPFFEEGLAMELEAVKIARREMGLKDAEIMIPFTCTLDAARDFNKVWKRITPNVKGLDSHS